MDTNDAKMLEAILALVRLIPEGKCVQAVTFGTRVSFADTTAGTVCALVIADNEDDLTRAGQIINNGIAAAQQAPGLLDRFVRTQSGRCDERRPG